MDEDMLEQQFYLSDREAELLLRGLNHLSWSVNRASVLGEVDALRARLESYLG